MTDIPKIKRMHRDANIGLYGSIGVALAVILFYYLSNYRFYLEARAARILMLGGVVLAVLVIAMALLTINRKPRQLRRIENLEQRLAEYQSVISSIYSSCLVSNVLLCVVITLCHDNLLLMFVIITTLLLFLAYPNMYKVKVDLGLDDEQMHTIYGDAYTETETEK